MIDITKIDNKLFHPDNQLSLDNFAKSTYPPSILLVGPQNSSKSAISYYYACQILRLSYSEINKYPYIYDLNLDAQYDHISIDLIRSIYKLISLVLLKNPKQSRTYRIIIIHNIEKMTIEAQNAFLKNLEQPPNDTIFILNASSTSKILSTILSRVKIVYLTKPKLVELKTYLNQFNYDNSLVQNAINYGLGWPGRTLTILNNPDEFADLIKQAKIILSLGKYQRLLLINDLTKDSQKYLKILDILIILARASLVNPKTVNYQTWNLVLDSSLNAKMKLANNANTKLVILDHFLSF